MTTPEGTTPADVPGYRGRALQGIAQRRGVRQFVKFCIVGFSSTLIDFAIYFALIEYFHIQAAISPLVGDAKLLGFLDAQMLGRIAANSISFLFAVSNGFIWNSRWTFRHTDREGLKARYFKFVLTNVIGLCLNLTILTLVSHVVPAALTAMLPHSMKDPAGFIGKLCATAVVVFWNFTASKYWTFKR
jgi:putative flippase GtrA